MLQDLLCQRPEIFRTVSLRVKGQNGFTINLCLIDRFAPADDRAKHVLAHARQLFIDIGVGGTIATVKGIAENPAVPLPFPDFFNGGPKYSEAVIWGNSSSEA